MLRNTSTSGSLINFVLIIPSLCLIIALAFLPLLTLDAHAADETRFLSEDKFIDSYKLGDALDNGIDQSGLFKDFDTAPEFGDLPPSFFDEMWSVEREYKNRIYEFDLDSRESETSWLVNSINKRLSVKGLLPLSPGQERKAHNYYYNFSLEHLEYVCEMGDIVACEVRDDRFTETVDNKGDGSGRKKADMNAKGTKRPDGPFAQETLNDKYQRAKIKEEYYREKARRSMDRYNTARRVGDIDAQIDFRQEHKNNKREL